MPIHNFNAFRNRWTQFCGLIILLSISACGQNPVLRDDAFKARGLDQQQHWQMKARVALKTADESLSATLDWDKDHQQFKFHLYGLFGVTYARLEQGQEGALLETRDHPVQQGVDAEILLAQTLGWNFPIHALSNWIKGLPAGIDGEQVTHNVDGQIDHIYYQDWQIKFSNFSDYSGYVMPNKLTATNPSLSMKIVVKSWEFLP